MLGWLRGVKHKFERKAAAKHSQKIVTESLNNINTKPGKYENMPPAKNEEPGERDAAGEIARKEREEALRVLLRGAGRGGKAPCSGARGKCRRPVEKTHRRREARPPAPTTQSYVYKNPVKNRIAENARVEFVVLNTIKRDRRSIEEIQIDLKQRRAAETKNAHPLGREGGAGTLADAATRSWKMSEKRSERPEAPSPDDEDFIRLQNEIYNDLINSGGNS